jgi:hypothetical protein
MKRWLARVRHDLIKHAVWRARDLRDLGAAPGPADLLALRRGLLELVDDEGTPRGAAALWRLLRAEAAETGSPPAAPLDDFEQAVLAAEAAVRELPAHPASWRQALAAVLDLEEAFAALARRLDPPRSK